MSDPGRKVVVMEARRRARHWARRSFPVVGFVLVALFGFDGAARADTYDADVDVNSTEPDAFDLRDTCDGVRRNLEAWFDLSPARALPIKVPGFKSTLSMGQTTITINCGAVNELSIAGSFAYKDQPSVAVDLGLTWGDAASDAIPDVSFDLDSTKTVAQDPIFSVADTVEWVTGLFGDAAAIDAGPLGGADITVSKLIVDADWTETDGFAIDATASTVLAQGDTAEVSDDLKMGYLLSVTKSAGANSEAVTLAGIHIANQDDQEETFNLGGVLRGAAGELVTDLELPEMYMATVQPSTATIKTSDLRPVAKAFFSEHGPDPAGLPPRDRDVNDSELTFDGDLTIGANVELDWFGGRVRDALGYEPGAKLQMIGEIGFSIADLFGDDADLDLQEVAIDILLPDITGSDGALIPDWIDLENGRIQIFWDDNLGILQIELDAEAHAIVNDNSQAPGWDPANPDAASASADPYEFPIVFDIAGLIEVIDEGGENTFVAALQAKTADQGDPGPAWPHPFGQTWLDLDAVGGEVELIVPAGGTTIFEAELVSTFQIGGKNFRFSAAVEHEQGVGTTVVLNLSMYDTISLNEVLGLFGDFQIPPDIFDLTIGTEQIVDPPDPDDPDAEDEPDGPPVSLTARIEAPDAGGFNAYLAINAPATFNFAGVQLPMNFLFSIAHVDGDLQLVVGGRTDPTKLSTILSGPLGQDFIDALPDGFDFDLPATGIAFASRDLDLQSADLVNDRPEEHEFFRHLYGCGDPPNADCSYRVQLDSGFHLLSAITLPTVEAPAESAGSDEPTAQLVGETVSEPVFGDVFRAFGMDPVANPPSVLFDAGVAMENPAEGIEFGSIGVKLRFPIKPAERPDWFHDASVGIELAFDAEKKEISFGIDGELAVRMRDETENATTCTGVMLTVVQGQSEKQCYDVLEFRVGAAVNISATPSLTLKGAIISDDGWTGPFGLDFLEFNSLALVLDITVQGSSPVVTIGFMMSGSLILPGDPATGAPPVKKDLAGSLAVGLRIVAPSPPYVIPQFQGLRIATKAGVELHDVVHLYDIVRDQTRKLEAQAENAGLFDEFPALRDFTHLPPLDIDQSQLPNVAVRNVELMIGLGNFEDVCIAPGFKLTGELYLNPTQPPPDVDATTPDNCFGEPLRPEECLTRPTPVPDGGLDPCFAAVSVDIGLGGIFLSGAQAAVDLGPVYIDDALLELELSATVQRLRTYGGGGIRGVAEGEMSVTVGSDGLAVLGDVVLFPTEGGANAFRAKIEAEATAGLNGVDFTQLDFSDPASLLALKFDLNAVLQADFEALVQNTAGQTLAVLRDSAVAMDAAYDALEAADGDTVDALRQLPDELRARGMAVPEWLENSDPGEFDVLQAVTQLEDTLEPFGVELPGFDTLFDGVPLNPPLPGIPGVWIPETEECHQVFFGVTSPTLGVVVDGTCYTYAPGTWFGGTDGVLGRFVQPKCYSVYPLAGTVLTNAAGEKECWALAPLTELPGLCDLGLDLVMKEPCSFDTFLTELVEPALAEVLTAAGMPDDLTFTAMIDMLVGQLDAATPPVDIRCASFRATTSDGQAEGGAVDPMLDLKIDVDVFGVDIDLGVGWDFGANPAAEGIGLFEDLLDAVLGRAPKATCEQLGTLTVAGGGAGGGSTPGTDPPTAGINESFDIAMAHDVVVEGEDAVLELTGLSSLPASTPLTVSWGDGTSESMTAGTAPSELRHVYRDDDPTGTSVDSYTIRASAGRLAAETETLTVRNSAPDEISLRPAELDEGDTFTLAGSFTDLGVDDTHQLRIAWGDGSASAVDVEPTCAEVTDACRRRTFSVPHTYLDDDADDTYTVTVTATDDDGGRRGARVTVTVRNVAPSNLSITPLDQAGDDAGSAPEGALVLYRVTFDDPGTLDTHRVTVNWGDGTTSVAPAAARTAVLSHRYLDDHPATGTPSDLLDVSVAVHDDDGGSALSPLQVRVDNVVPTVEIETLETIEEGDELVVRGELTDPSPLDTFQVVVDWGYDSFTDVTIDLPAGARTFEARRTYGDNGTYIITATVTDDDTGAGSDTATATVDNVDPTVAVSRPDASANGDAGTVQADGPDDDAELDTPTFLTRAGAALRLEGRATDPGSDDLTFTWDWDASDRFDTATTTTMHRVAAGPDPFPSPEVIARDVTAWATHTWTQPCLYEVGLEVTDDDGGAGSDGTWVVVTGTDDRLRRPGWWHNQYDFSGKRNKNDISADTATCYLESVRHMSRVFSTFRSCATFTEAMGILNTRQTSNGDEIMVRQLLASWLNFAQGSIGWFDMVDTDGDGSTDTAFHEVLAAAESLRLDPGTTRSELLAYEDVLERINGE